MSRAAFTTSYGDEENPFNRRSTVQNDEYFYEQRRRQILGNREDSEELFRQANPHIDLPEAISPAKPLVRTSTDWRVNNNADALLLKKEGENNNNNNYNAASTPPNPNAGALALYSIPKLYAGDIAEPRRLLQLPPVPEEQLRQYAVLISNAMKSRAAAAAATAAGAGAGGGAATDPDAATAALLSYQPLVGFYERYFFEKRKLGSGGFADVFEAVDKLDGMSYAIKRIRFKSVAHFCRHYNKILREVRVLAKLSHRNVLRYYSAWIEISSTQQALPSSAHQATGAAAVVGGAGAAPAVVHGIVSSPSHSEIVIHHHRPGDTPRIAKVQELATPSSFGTKTGGAGGGGSSSQAGLTISGDVPIPIGLATKKSPQIEDLASSPSASGSGSLDNNLLLLTSSSTGAISHPLAASAADALLNKSLLSSSSNFPRNQSTESFWDKDYSVSASSVRTSTNSALTASTTQLLASPPMSPPPPPPHAEAELDAEHVEQEESELRVPIPQYSDDDDDDDDNEYSGLTTRYPNTRSFITTTHTSTFIAGQSPTYGRRTHRGGPIRELNSNSSSSSDSSSSSSSFSSDSEESEGFLHPAASPDLPRKGTDRAMAGNILRNNVTGSSYSTTPEELVRVPPPKPPKHHQHARHQNQRREDPQQTQAQQLPNPESVTFTLFIKTQLHNNETLKDWLARRRAVDAVESMRVFRQLLEALAYIHQNGICHRDIKPGNIFMGSDDTVVLGDFGLAKELFSDNAATSLNNSTTSASSSLGLNASGTLDPVMCGCASDPLPPPPSMQPQPVVAALANSNSTPVLSSSSRHTSRLGTAAYAAPEQIAATGEYSNLVDIFPAGIILFELLSIFSSGHERGHAINNLRKGVLPSNFIASHPIASKWIIRMTDPKPEMRPTCNEILSSDLFIVPLLASVRSREASSAESNPNGANVTSPTLGHSNSATPRSPSGSVAAVDAEYLSKIKDTKLLVRIILEQQRVISELKGAVEDRDLQIQQLDTELRQLRRLNAASAAERFPLY